MPKRKHYKHRHKHYKVNYKKRILETYKIMEEENLNYKVVKIKVPYYDKYELLGQPGQVIHDIPNYAVVEGTAEKSDGNNGETCYDESIACALLNFKEMPAIPITCYIKVTIPLYNMLQEQGLILE